MTKLKIIQSDNLGREHISDRVICENIVNIAYAEIILKTLNIYGGGSVVYKIMRQDEKIYTFEG